MREKGDVRFFAVIRHRKYMKDVFGFTELEINSFYRRRRTIVQHKGAKMLEKILLSKKINARYYFISEYVN